jgi:c-di-GMP-binding flagellar brake protein YcgR
MATKPTTSESIQDERRSFPRIPLLSEVWIEDDTNNRHHLTTTDLSVGGMCVLGENLPLTLGSMVVVELRLPDVDEVQRLPAQVAWRGKTAMGIRFQSLPKAQATLIDEAVAKAMADLASFEDEATPVHGA